MSVLLSRLSRTHSKPAILRLLQSTHVGLICCLPALEFLMKIVRLLILLVFLLAGLVIGSLNSQPIVINFGVSALATTSGIAIIVSLFAGVVIGAALVLTLVAIPLYARLRRANKAANAVGVPVSSHL